MLRARVVPVVRRLCLPSLSSSSSSSSLSRPWLLSFARAMSTKAPPVIAGRAPQAVEVEAGKTYYWCTCGRSKKQPFCDGSHKQAPGYAPKAWTADEAGTKYFCLCKRTSNPPFCDGSHAKLPKEGAVDIEDLGKAPKASSPSGGGSTVEEPYHDEIKELARAPLSSHHGPMGAMGVPGPELPRWSDIQILVSQLARKPLPDDAPVNTKLVIGPRAKKPLTLDIPLFVSDMSFGSLSEHAKVALARGAELAGTGICSGEGGMLPEEQEANSRYFYELASAKFGFSWDKVKKCQAFHFKGGQGAKTGTGGHLPANKVTDKIALVRNLPKGKDAVSPPAFPDLNTAADFKRLADEVREKTGGIPIGFKLSANHIEDDIQFALDASADYIILDGRGGGTGAAPLIFRNNISVPTIPALARARAYLDRVGARDVTLIITGGLRVPADFFKALCLGADGVAISNSALQSIGCVAARMCNTNMCPAGIATQDPSLFAKLDVDKGAKQLGNFFKNSASLMRVLARACSCDDLAKLNSSLLTTWKRDMAEVSGVGYAGMGLKFAGREKR